MVDIFIVTVYLTQNLEKYYDKCFLQKLLHNQYKEEHCF